MTKPKFNIGDEVFSSFINLAGIIYGVQVFPNSERVEYRLYVEDKGSGYFIAEEQHLSRVNFTIDKPQHID